MVGVWTSPENFRGPLSQCILYFSDRHSFHLCLCLNKSDADPLRAVLIEIVRRPDLWCHKLMTLRLNDILRLLEQASLSRSSIRQKACARIQTALMSKYGLRGLPRLVFRIPFTKNRDSSGIRSAFSEILAVTGLPQVVQSRICQELRIIATKRRSIADILYNHRSFAKSFNQHSPPQCVCQDTLHKIRLPDHFHDKISAVLSQNSKNNSGLHLMHDLRSSKRL
jgi:hypothetical protein